MMSPLHNHFFKGYPPVRLLPWDDNQPSDPSCHNFTPIGRFRTAHVPFLATVTFMIKSNPCNLETNVGKFPNRCRSWKQNPVYTPLQPNQIWDNLRFLTLIYYLSTYFPSHFPFITDNTTHKLFSKMENSSRLSIASIHSASEQQFLSQLVLPTISVTA